MVLFRQQQHMGFPVSEFSIQMQFFWGSRDEQEADLRKGSSEGEFLMRWSMTRERAHLPIHGLAAPWMAFERRLP